MSEQKKLKVVLLRYTPMPEEAIALSAKLCYSKFPGRTSPLSLKS